MAFIVPENRRLVQIGQAFGRLTVCGESFWLIKGPQRVQYAVFRCDCGTLSLAESSRVRRMQIRSCGCLVSDAVRLANTTHGGEGTELYSRWHGIKVRCHTRTSKDWHRYGGRGISVCGEWRENFIAFMEWAVASGFRTGLQIDRIDNDGPYSPSNCRWVSAAKNSNNKSTTVFIEAFGSRKPLSEWLIDPRCLVSQSTVYSRLKLGWCHEDAIGKPARKLKCQPHSCLP